MIPFVPAEPIPPGDIIKDELDAREWTYDDLAEVIEISRRHILNLVQGKTAITTQIASLLEEAFGIDAKDWMSYQVSYELALVAQKSRKVKKRATIYEKLPIREMVRRGWIDEEKDVDRLEDITCRFLRIQNINETPNLKLAARKSDSYDEVSPSQMAWYFRAKELAECVGVTNKYDEKRFDNIADTLRSMAAHRVDVRRIPKALADAGIRLVIIEHLKGSKVDGACFWLDKFSPVIALSLRYDRIDNFWFTLMHEMAHVKYRDQSSVDIDIMDSERDLPDCEQRANRYASESLISKERLDSFILRNSPLYIKKRIIEFANARGIHPGIVVGQLHWRREIKYSRMRPLLEKVREEITGHALTDGWGDCPVIGESQ